MGEIPNMDLRADMLPAQRATWDEISNFAHTFNGYEHWGSLEKCGEIANRARDQYDRQKLLPASITDLRTCLFFEARRWRHYGYDPGDADLIYLRALLEEVRTRVRLGILDE